MEMSAISNEKNKFFYPPANCIFMYKRAINFIEINLNSKFIYTMLLWGKVQTEQFLLFET